MASSKSVERSQLFFDPFLTCTLAVLRERVEQAMAEEGRFRSRRPSERARASLIIQAHLVVSNAAYALALGLEPPTVGIALGRPGAKRIARYEGPALRQIASVLSAIAPALVDITVSRKKGVASVLTPSADLRHFLASFPSFGAESFLEGGETVVVHRVTRDPQNYGRLVRSVDYKDDAETFRMRGEMGRINSAIRAADLSFVGPEPIAVQSRRLRRIFNTYSDAPSFDLGGRLFGGWWETLRGELRGHIRIDGRKLVDLDFSNMHLRLAYASAGLEPPSGDLYGGIIPGTGKSDAYRAGVKRFLNAMITRGSPMTRMPRDLGTLLPKGTKVKELREAVFSRHSAIRDIFESDAGGRLARLESDILVAVLLRLLDAGIVALPMHDGLMVREDLAGAAEKAMTDISHERVGAALPVFQRAL